jgi:hypothetical protein
VKHGRKPTREQRKLLAKYHLDGHDWLIIKDTPEAMTIVHRFSDSTIKTIPKGV